MNLLRQHLIYSVFELKRNEKLNNFPIRISKWLRGENKIVLFVVSDLVVSEIFVSLFEIDIGKAKIT